VHSDGATGTVVGYDRGTGRVFVDRRQSGDVGFSPLFPSFESVPVQLNADGSLELSIYLDRSSVEVFAQGGRASITDQVFPAAGANRISLFAEGGTAQAVSFKSTPLASSMFGAGGASRYQGRPAVGR
jgi:levanase